MSLTPKERINAAVEDIKDSEWVAMDFEFSGLFTQKPRAHHQKLEDHFDHVVESVSSYGAIQVAFCCVKKERQTTHEFYIVPRQKFQVDMLSLRFLRRHRFDMNKFVDNFMECDKIGKSRTNGITKVVEALLEHGCPLIFHHGLFDIVHFANCFLDDVEDMKQEDFLDMWKEKVPNPIFDTRYLGSEGKLTVLRHAGGLGLQDLYRSVCKKKVAEDDGHSSAQDAIMTAELFQMEMKLFLKHENEKESRKRKLEEGEKKKTFFEEPVAKRFRNFIAVSACAPGFFKLKD